MTSGFNAPSRTFTVRKFVCPLMLAAMAVACQKPTTTPAATTAAATDAKAAAPAAPAKPVPAVLPEVIADCNGDKIAKAEFENALRAVEQRAGGQIPPEELSVFSNQEASVNIAHISEPDQRVVEHRHGPRFSAGPGSLLTATTMLLP